MTTEQKYAEVLKALGEVIADKNVTISIKDYHVQEVKEKLAAAEAERDGLRGMIMNRLAAINKAIRACVDLEAKEITDAEMLLDLQGDIQSVLQLVENNGGAA